jgi:hypothetical protein
MWSPESTKTEIEMEISVGRVCLFFNGVVRVVCSEVRVVFDDLIDLFHAKQLYVTTLCSRE